ncbi:MAG: peptidylprolyl isomerase [Myxococcota bacterium]
MDAVAKISKDSVVSIEYTLTDEAGVVVGRSPGNDPLSYVHGRGGVVPGLERELTGKSVGDQVSVTLEQKDGYGVYDDTLTFEMPRARLPATVQPQKGMALVMNGAGGRQFPVVILEVKPESVVIDRNHPFAGKTLRFDVRVKGLREARPEELNDCCSSGTCSV